MRCSHFSHVIVTPGWLVVCEFLRTLSRATSADHWADMHVAAGKRIAGSELHYLNLLRLGSRESCSGLTGRRPFKEDATKPTSASDKRQKKAGIETLRVVLWAPLLPSLR